MKNAVNTKLVILALGLLEYSCRVNSGAVQFTSENFDKTIASTELVFVNFYADWCYFSNQLSPIWDEAAEMVSKKLGASRVVLGKVDCDEQEEIASRFFIGKYPTLKLVRNGHPAKGEYRGQRSAEALLAFLEGELRDPITLINTTEDIKQEKRGQVIGYFESRDSPSYQSFEKMAASLKDYCQVLAGIGEQFRHLRLAGRDTVVVRKAGSDEDLTPATPLDLTNTGELTDWAQGTCVPLVREITFSNAEELTEERLPFLILFHSPDDAETPRRYSKFVEDNLRSEKASINFLTADGHQFAHPLYHLGKSPEDLPLIAIDSFRHMYVFSDIKDMETPGKLKQFIDDLHSGKLHREFHYGPETPEPSASETEPAADGASDATEATTRPPTSPPESVFKKLSPSENRYSILKEEL